MEDTQFDDMAKMLGAQKTRRLTLGALLGGALTALGLLDPDEAWAAKSGKCKPGPGECQTCKKGKCKKQNGKKKCKKGKILPKADGTLCSAGTCVTGTCLTTGGGGGGGGGGGCPLCQVRQGGVCVNAPAGTACNGIGKCNGSGTCNPAPQCAAKGVFCLLAAATACCSGTCAGETIFQTSGTCAKSALGEPCRTNADCNEGISFLAVCGNSFTCQSLLDT